MAQKHKLVYYVYSKVKRELWMQLQTKEDFLKIIKARIA